jgi:hypothetical protein
MNLVQKIGQTTVHASDLRSLITLPFTGKSPTNS